MLLSKTIRCDHFLRPLQQNPPQIPSHLLRKGTTHKKIEKYLQELYRTITYRKTNVLRYIPVAVQ